MKWSTQRKLVYFLVFIIIFGALIGTPAYFLLHKDPTCFDNQQNQTEDGIDCGGPCVKLCNPLELLPVVMWQQSFEVSPGVYSAAAYIQNPNLNGIATNVPYTFTLSDADNNVIATRSGTTNIPAGKNFALFEGGISVATATPVRTDFSFTKTINWVATRTKEDLQVQNIAILNPLTSPSITADIQNPDVSPVGRQAVVVLVYDVGGNAFAASRTVIDGIGSQSQSHIVFTWPLPFEKTPVRAEIIPVAQ